MAERGSITPVSSLDLTAEQRSAVSETIAANVAVYVYRELESARATAELAGNSGCQVIANCSSSCSR